MNNVKHLPSRKPAMQEVHEIQFHLIPESVKDDVLGSVFSLLAASENLHIPPGLQEEIDEVRRAFEPCYRGEYSVIKHRQV
jgi:hypothetical protein